MVRLEVDCASDAPVGDVLKMLETHAGNLERFIAVGPGGGNPCLFLTFPSRVQAESFVDAWEGPYGDPDYIKTLIQD